MSIDIQVAKDAARGQWAAIANQVFGIPDDYLTPKPGPCPKCKCGTDRWKVFKDFSETGGAMCNQCGKSADGFALGQWWLGCSLNEAIEKVCQFLGVTDSKPKHRQYEQSSMPKLSRSEPPKPTKDLPITLRPWNDKHFQMCFESKKPITMEAVKLAGGTVAKHYGDTVMAFPCIGRDGKPTGWAMYNITGGPIKYRPSENEPFQDLKIKLIGCHGGGWIGRINPNRPDDPIFKVEGVSDVLTLLSANPEASVITNANGAGQDPLHKDRQWMLEILRGRIVYTIHDRDDAGQDGALWTGTDVRKRPGWAVAIALIAKESRNVQLPFEMNSKEPNRKDIRDYFNGKLEERVSFESAFLGLLQIAEKSPVLPQPKDFQLADKFSEQTTDPNQISNARTKYLTSDDGTTTKTDEPVPILDIAKSIFEHAGNWPKRVGNDLFVRSGDAARLLKKPSSVLAWLRESIKVNWKQGPLLPTKEEIFEILWSHCERYESTESNPHFPSIANVYYTCEDRPVGSGKHLEQFLDFFCPSTPIDRQLLLAAIATTFWGGPPGARPGFQFSATTGQGAGKTTAAVTIARLTGGSIDFDQGCKREEITKRLLSGETGCRVVLLDNIKAQTFSSASFESLITAKSISGHQMYSGNAAKPNHFTFFVTFNSANFSRDMAQRLVTIVLKDAQRSADWQTRIDKFVAEHRDNLIDDVKAFFDRPTRELTHYNRWALWQGQIISRLDDPESIIEELASRESANDGDAKMAMDFIDHVFEFLRGYGYETPYRVHIGSKELAVLVRDAIGSPQTPREASSLIDRLIACGLIQNMRRNPCNKFGRGYLYWSPTGESKTVDYGLAEKIEILSDIHDSAKEARRAKARRNSFES